LQKTPESINKKLSSTSYKRRTPFATVDNTSRETTVCSVDNSCGLTSKSNRGPCYYLHICYFVCETRTSPGGGVWEVSECGNRISDANFLIVFYSNYGSILLSFRDMTMGQTTDGRTTDQRRQSSHIRFLVG